VALLGVAGAIAFARLAFLLPYALFGTLFLLGVGFYWVYRPLVMCADGTRSAIRRSTLRWIVWLSALLAGVLIVVAFSSRVLLSSVLGLVVSGLTGSAKAADTATSAYKVIGGRQSGATR
jgi:hypothetical protein